MRKLKIGPRGDREILIEREFDARRELVFDAYTKPELLKRWLGVFGGWELAVCEIDLRVGGRYRWGWRNTERKAEMGASGVYREIVVPDRIVCTEQFDDPWYEGEAIVSVTFVERDGTTTLTMVLLYGSTETRDSVLRSPMDTGLERGFDTLAEILAKK